MKVLFPLKYIRYGVQLSFKSQAGMEVVSAKSCTRHFDELAVEEAVRPRGKGVVTEVIAVSCGRIHCQETLRSAIGIGADRAILVKTASKPQPLTVAQILKALVDKERPGLVILGKQCFDEPGSPTGDMLAALAGLPQATYVTKADLTADSLSMTRNVDGGRRREGIPWWRPAPAPRFEALKLTLPAIITPDSRLNDPRDVPLSVYETTRERSVELLRPADLGVKVRAQSRH